MSTGAIEFDDGRTAKLPLDRSEWCFLGNIDGTYSVASIGKQKVLAPSVTLAQAVQIVDEHRLACKLYDMLALYREGRLIVDRDDKQYLRTMLDP
jgi:hypothetical protein